MTDPTIKPFTFPTTDEEAKTWKPTFRRKALHFQVLAVAKTRIEGKWAAYVFPVPGRNHDEEEKLWKTKGAKMPEAWARPLFPEFAGLPYAR